MEQAASKTALATAERRRDFRSPPPAGIDSDSRPGRRLALARQPDRSRLGGRPASELRMRCAGRAGGFVDRTSVRAVAPDRHNDFPQARVAGSGVCSAVSPCLRHPDAPAARRFHGKVRRG
jgi:hypothetical protein